MRIPNVVIPKTHRRISSRFLPGFACLLAAVGFSVRQASASESSSTNSASRAQLTPGGPVRDPPSDPPPRSGGPDPGSDPSALYHAGIVDYKEGKYVAAIDALKKYIAVAGVSHVADANLYLGDAYAATKDYDSAIAAYSKYMSEHPQDGSHSAPLKRAAAYMKLGKNAEAAADFKLYLGLEPHDTAAWNSYIAVLLQTEKVASADLIEALTGAVVNDPANLSLRARLAKMQIDAKDYAGAIAQYDAILAAKPGDSRALFNRGVAYGLEKESAKAAADFVAYTKLKPEDPSGWNHAGVFLGQQRDYRGSIDAFTRYIALNPTESDFIVVYKNRGIAYYDAEDWTNAESDLRRYIAARPDDADAAKLLEQAIGHSNGDPTATLEDLVQRPPGNTDPNTWFNLGIAYLAKDNYRKAVDAFTKSYELKADSQTLYNRSLAYYDMAQAGDSTAYGSAAKDAAAALEMKPDYADALLVKADVEYAQKNTLLAGADYARFVALQGVSADDKLYAEKRLLQASIRNKDFAGAIAASTSLIESHPAEPQSYLVRGTAYIATKKFAAAVTDLMKYTHIKDDDATGWYNLGIACSATGDVAFAAVGFEKASILEPDNYDAAEQAGIAYKALGDSHQAHAVQSEAEYEKAIERYDKAARIPTDTRKQKSDALYNEGAALEAKARIAGEPDALRRAIGVWRQWMQLAPKDPEVPKIKARVIYLQRRVGKGS